ncbi:MAG: DUF368 domain-containing protein [Oscillospiraceae bacterium]
MEFIQNVLCGLIIGVANIIPGVSGGTMAVVLGIYDKLIAAIGGLFSDFKNNLLLLIPVGIGGGIGILMFSKLIQFLLAIYPMATNFFFLGLIAGSIPMIYKRAVNGKLRLPHIVSLLCSFAIMMALTFAFTVSGSNEILRTLDITVIFRLIICSAVAAACMILPGVSGSMVLMLLGVYMSVLTAISELNIVFLIPVIIGVAIGILGGAKIIKACLNRAPQVTYCAILGLIIGSLFPVFFNAGFVFNLQGIAALAALLAGTVVSILLSKLQKNIQPSK